MMLEMLEATTTFEGVEAVSETLDGLLCKIGDRRPRIAAPFLRQGNQVRKPGDRGRLVIPAWLAASLGLSPFGEPVPGPGARA